MFIHLISVEKAVNIYGFLQKWRKNPQWSFSCCLALLLPLNDLQGDIGGFVVTSGGTEEIDVPSLLNTVKENEAVDANFYVTGKDESSIKAQKKSFQRAEYNTMYHHTGTQTDPFLLSSPDAVLSTKLVRKPPS